MRLSYSKVVPLIGLLSAIGAGSMWMGTNYRSDIQRARARVASGSQTIETPCGRIEFATAGDGPTILMVHGAGGGFDQGMLLASSFVPTGYRVIAMSRFGYLRTPVPAHASIGLQADAHACLLDALGVKSAVVVAVSAGAPSALEFALRHAERCTALVLVVPGWFPRPERVPSRFGPLAGIVFEWGLHSDLAFWTVGRLFPAPAMRAVLGTPSNVIATASATERARLDSMLWSILPISQRSTGLSLEARLTVERLSKPLEFLQVPTLVISAKDDLYGTWENAQFIAAAAPQGHLIGYSVGGHMLVGHVDEVLDAIAHFLKENRTDAGE